MVSYCPNCGVEAKKGYKFCLNCGTNLKLYSSFGEQSTKTPVENTPIQDQQLIPQQSNYQTQDYVPFQKRKSNTILFTGVIAIIVAFVVILAIVFILFGNNISSSDFVGTWRLDSAVVDGNTTSAPFEMTFTFYSNDTYEVTAFGSPDTTGKWSASNGKLYTPNSNTSVPPSMDYHFSSDKNTLTLSYSMDVGDQVYSMSLILKRESSSSNSNSGNSHQLDESLVGNWTLSSMIINGQNTPLTDIIIDFNSDGTYKSTESTFTNETGTWYVSNMRLFFQTSSGGSNIFYSSTTGMNYQLTNDWETLTLSYSTSYNSQTYSMIYVFEKTMI